MINRLLYCRHKLFSCISACWHTKLNPLLLLLLPLSFLFGLVVFVRRKLFQLGVCETTKLPVPVVVVGNINVGGTGKTQLVIFLANLLHAQGYRVGIVMRGYKAKYKTDYLLVADSDPVDLIGDEAKMLQQRTKAHIALARKRSVAVAALVDRSLVDIVISDDGLQHYAMHRDLEIAVVDAAILFGNNFLLPAGPLREPRSRIELVDFVIYKGCSQHKYEFKVKLVGVFSLATKDKLDSSVRDVVAVAGIGNPDNFYKLLQQHHFNVLNFSKYADHEHYTADHFQIALEYGVPILITEKDAVKCGHLPKYIAEKIFYVKVDTVVSDVFVEDFLCKLKEF